MRELHWTPAEVASAPNRTVMDLLALFRLESERASRAVNGGMVV